MKVLDRVEIMVRLKEKIYEARKAADMQLVTRLESLLDDIMQNPAAKAI